MSEPDSETGRHIVKDGVWLIPQPTAKERREMIRRSEEERKQRRRQQIELLMTIRHFLYWPTPPSAGIFDGLGALCTMACPAFGKPASPDANGHFQLYSELVDLSYTAGGDVIPPANGWEGPIDLFDR